MRDGLTRKKNSSPSRSDREAERRGTYRGALVVLAGKAPGDEIELLGARTVFGRGPGVDVEMPDVTMSRQHFLVEAEGRRFRIRDLGSTNGVLVNGKAVEAAGLTHGDRVKAGNHEFQFLLEKIQREPRTYVVPD
jgi:pSer/pThr/pTyr-binding forkhead associated (FHA) protein